jgi:uncharacterized repeat protein (TIGR02543 family)
MRGRVSFWFSIFLTAILIVNSISFMHVQAETSQVDATGDEMKKTTIHTYGSNTWAYSSLAKGPNDELYVAHVVDGTSIALKRWSGTTWSSVTTVTTATTSDSGIGGPLKLVADSNGNLHLGFKFYDGSGVSSYRGIKYGFYNVQTSGWTFQEIEAYSDPSGWKNFDDPTLAVNPSTGSVHMVYLFSDANTRNHYVQYATNESGSWTKGTIVTSNGGIDELHLPQIAVGGNNKVHVTYIREDQQNDYFGNLYYVTKSTSGSSFSTPLKLINSTGEQKEYWSYPLTLDGNGAVYIAYSGPTTSYILTNATGSWQSEPFYVDNTRTTGPLSVHFVGSQMYLLMESWGAGWSDVYFFAMKKTATGWEKGTKNVAPAEAGPTSELTYTVDSQGNYMLVMLDDGLRIISSLSGSSAAFGLNAVVTPTYGVSYDGNGQNSGNVPTDGKQYKQGDLVTVLGNTGNLQKTGYTFAGWNTAANGTGTSFAPGANFAMPGNNVTLYAQWTPNTYTVTYDPQGGVVGTNTQVKLFGSTYGKGSDGITADPLPTPTRGGYSFAGWYTQANGAGSQVTNSTTVTMTSNHTLYAKWTINQYTVSFDVDGGNAVTPQTVNHGAKATQPADPAKTGYTFAGWFTDNTYATGFDFNNTVITGNTVIYAKWVINQYTVSFDSNGGSAVTPVTTNYNTTITAPTPPTRTGYTFGGWFKEAGLTTAWNFTTDKVTQNTMLYAKWTINQYTVSFDVDGGSVVAPQTVNYGDKAVQPSEPTKTGYTFAGWFTDNTYATGFDFNNTVITGNTVIYAKWVINQYTVSFDSNGGSAVTPTTVDYNSTISAPTPPTRTGYTFGGWFKEANLATLWNFPTDRVTQNTTLHAKWTINQYSVSFDVDGGSSVAPQTVNYGDKAVEPTPPTKTGYTFAGWFANNSYMTAYDFNNMVITGNTVIYAKWNINQYTVSFNSNGGSAVAPVVTNYNTTIAAPTSPTRMGYTFGGWFKDAGLTSAWNFATDKVTQNTTLYAKWTINQYKVSFDVDGGSSVAPQTVNYGEKALEPTPPTKTGYTFAGWFANNSYMTAYDFNNMVITGNTVIYAKWNINQYTVTFDSNGGSAVAPVVTNYNTTIAAPTHPTRTGYTFGGWFKDAGLTSAWNFATDKVTQNTTLYVKWTINQYSVSFDVDGGSAVVPQTVNYGEKAVEPAPPTKTGYTFAGWFTDNSFTTGFDFNNRVITGTTVIYAKWMINQYTVSFESNGGSAIAPVTTDYNTTITTPTPPTRTGYTFGGWYEDAGLTTAWNFATEKVTQNTTLYAKWTINQYIVSFHVDGGSVVAEQTVNHGSKATQPATPTKTGYTFAGWFTDHTYTTGFDFTHTDITSHTTIYAKWNINQYTVSFDSNGGSLVEPVITNYNTTIAAPTPPTRTGYTFSGWFKDVGLLTAWDFATDRVTQDTTIYIKWTINQYTVSFEANGGSPVAPQTINYNDPVAGPTFTSKTGYTFVGWYKEAALTTLWDFQTDKVTDDTTLYAKWQINSYTVSFHSNGGSSVHSVTAIYNTTITEPAQPTRNGAIFSGWYTDRSYQTMWDFSKNKVTTDTTLYALWTLAYLPEPGPKPTPDPNPNPQPTPEPNPEVDERTHLAYIKGYSDNTFRPDASVTRVQMAVMLVRNLGINDLSITGNYDDVKETHWAYKEIMLAKQSGIMMGVGNQFNPSASITRAQMATIVYRWVQNECAKDASAFEQCSKLAEIGDSSYSDVDRTHWASEAIVATKQFGFMDGFEDGTFKPNDNLTRAQAVVVLNRLFKRGPIEGDLTPTFTDVPKNHWAFREIEAAVRNYVTIITSDAQED